MATELEFKLAVQTPALLEAACEVARKLASEL